MAAGDSQEDETPSNPQHQHKIEVDHDLARCLRPHQREGVQFLFECTMGLRGFSKDLETGEIVREGCILADDMGLGKTLMSITLIWTLMNQGFTYDKAAVRKVIVACPTSLVGNWNNEISKWLKGRCTTFPVMSNGGGGDAKKTIKNFVNHRGKGVLIINYETQRRYSKEFQPSKFAMKASAGCKGEGDNSVCQLLICDEAHKLKNADSQLAISLSQLPAKKRVLLSGTPMQNELTEFFNMVNFCNPGILGCLAHFRKVYERPILESREPDASGKVRDRAATLQNELSTIVNEFILKRGNILNAQHLPPKLVQFVCCRLTETQQDLYDAIINNKDVRHLAEGNQKDTLNYIRHLINVCGHPQLVYNSYEAKVKENVNDAVLSAVIKAVPPPKHSGGGEEGDSKNRAIAPRAPGRSGKLLQGGGISRESSTLDPMLSGKLGFLYKMMATMRALKNGERIVIVSNYTSTLDLIGRMCSQNGWPFLRLDGSIASKKRTSLVDQFNDPYSSQFAFLLSSKAGGCGINLIGGNRLVLFDPDWNPASDKQAAGRVWREGQKRRCFIYRLMSTGTIEEKIIQRQLSKEVYSA